MEAILLAILGFFALGTWGFWAGIVFLSITYTIATESDAHKFAIFCTFLFAGLFWKVWSILTIPLVLIGVSSYAAVGGLYSIWRWFKYCRQYIADHPIKEVSDYDLHDYVAGAKVRISSAEYYQKKLRPIEHKSRLIGWIVYWPWSFMWNIIGDTLTAVYDALTNVYERTATSVIRRATNASKMSVND